MYSVKTIYKEMKSKFIGVENAPLSDMIHCQSTNVYCMYDQHCNFVFANLILRRLITHKTLSLTNREYTMFRDCKLQDKVLFANGMFEGTSPWFFPVIRKWTPADWENLCVAVK